LLVAVFGRRLFFGIFLFWVAARFLLAQVLVLDAATKRRLMTKSSLSDHA
jgi:hypothetical protein